MGHVISAASVSEPTSLWFWALHAFHAGLVLVGVAAVALLLMPHGLDRRRLGRMRGLDAEGLVRAAEQRALTTLRPRATIDAPGLLAVVVTSNLFAAGVHAAVCPEHFREGLRFGLFFLVLTAVQVSLSVAAVRRPSPRLLAVAAIVNLEVIVLWALTRTVGLPYGLAEIEPIGFWDAAATAAELLMVVAVVRMLVLSVRAATTNETARFVRVAAG